MSTSFLSACVFAVALTLGCAGGTITVKYDGSVECAHCKMNILDNKFGAALATAKGKVYYFDGPECMVPFVIKSDELRSQEVVQQLVTDYNTPGTLIPVEKANFLHSPALQSPMAGNVAAFSDAQTLESAKVALPNAEQWTWSQVQAKFRNRR